MYLKKLRNKRVALVESRYIRKGAAGNTHGYSEAVVICRLPASTTSLPTDVDQRLNEAQRRFLDVELLLPNRRLEAEAKAAEEAKERDPTWRLVEAARLIAEARSLCQSQPVDTSVIRRVRDTLNELAPPDLPLNGLSDQPADPLKAAISAVQAAARAVALEYYGAAPETGARESSVYKRWQALNAAVTGPEGESLQRVLQRAGWVKKKGGTS